LSRPGRAVQLPVTGPGVLRLAMWSGPRNISTAFMRSWENRDDTIVFDEPFYAHYLAVTGSRHPGREEVLARHETDWRRVLQLLLAEVPAGVRIVYQKQMAHHLLPDMGREWLDAMTHAFLIRDPRPMLASLERKLGDFELLETGLPQQVEIFDHVCRTTGQVPPVIDSADILAAPEPMMRKLCEALGVPFSSKMLSWPPGPRDSDGVWAKHWYERVEASTGFEAQGPPGNLRLTGRVAKFEARCRPLYEKLHEQRLTT
jgi:Sulfotransferase domain